MTSLIMESMSLDMIPRDQSSWGMTKKEGNGARVGDEAMGGDAAVLGEVNMTKRLTVNGDEEESEGVEVVVNGGHGGEYSSGGVGGAL